MCTAWLLLAGTQVVRNTSDMARFGAMLFQILAPLQLALAIFFSALLAASGVAQEKDRRTLVLLLLTRLSNSELALGKLLASMLNVLVLVAASLPVFFLSALFGGVSFAQIGRVFAVTFAAVLAAGSLGSTLALARQDVSDAGFDRTRDRLLARRGRSRGARRAGSWLGRRVVRRLGRRLQSVAGDPRRGPTVGRSPQSAAARGRRRQPVRLVRAVADRGAQRDRDPHGARVESLARNPRQHGRSGRARKHLGPYRGSSGRSPCGQIAQRPLGRRQDAARVGQPDHLGEIATWAHGRKVLVIKLAYIGMVALAAVTLHAFAQQERGLDVAQAALVLVPLFVLSLVLINAQSVTSMTIERDIRALDLLLVTDLTAKEFVFGKLGGVFYNAKEMILLPMALCVYLWVARTTSGENLLYLLGGLVVMDAFVAMLGLHAGMSYGNSRTAIGVSLGTVFFLFVGIATCMRMMIAFSGSFHWQIQPFLAFMLGGSVGLYAALGRATPPLAILVASIAAPIATFWAITSFLLQYTLSVFLVTRRPTALPRQPCSCRRSSSSTWPPAARRPARNELRPLRLQHFRQSIAIMVERRHAHAGHFGQIVPAAQFDRVAIPGVAFELIALAGVHRAALQRQALHARRRELGEIIGIGRDDSAWPLRAAVPAR